MTVYRHLRIFLILKSVPFRRHEEIIKGILKTFEMSATMGRQISLLSEGEKVKLKIATALLCNPTAKYIFLD